MNQAAPITSSPEDAFADLHVQRIDTALRKEASKLSHAEARLIVDAYYAIQKLRVGTSNRLSAIARQTDDGPAGVFTYLKDQQQTLEGQVKNLLNGFAKNDPLGAWALSITGIGPVIAAGLLAHISIQKAPTAGHVWRYAGLDPSLKWQSKDSAKKIVTAEIPHSMEPHSPEAMEIMAHALNIKSYNFEKRIRTMLSADDDVPLSELNITRTTLANAAARLPWNDSLKKLCFIIGDSFVKQSTRDSDVYGKLYHEVKARETRVNEAGGFSKQAAQALSDKNYTKGTVTQKAYAAGMLPDAHLHARAKRHVVKLFLSHYHAVGRHQAGLEVPRPYAIAILDHAHFIDIPNRPW